MMKTFGGDSNFRSNQNQSTSPNSLNVDLNLKREDKHMNLGGHYYNFWLYNARMVVIALRVDHHCVWIVLMPNFCSYCVISVIFIILYSQTKPDRFSCCLMISNSFLFYKTRSLIQCAFLFENGCGRVLDGLYSDVLLYHVSCTVQTSYSFLI